VQRILSQYTTAPLNTGPKAYKNMKKLILFLLLIPVLVNAQVTAEKRMIGSTPAIVYRPSNFNAANKYAVYLYLHGDGQVTKETADLNRLQSSGDQAELLLAAEKNNFIVVAPQLVLAQNAWYPGWKDQYLQSVYDYIISSPNTDLNHIIVTGLSRGGGGTWIVCTGVFAQYVSAAIPICGTPQYEQDFSQVAKYNIPIWAFHAKDDQTVNWAATVNTISKIMVFNPTPEPKTTYFDSGGHPIWGRVYSDQSVYTWALSKSNNIVTAPPAPTPIDDVIGTYKITVYKSGKIEIVKQ
jgi:predicted peptidase